MVNNRPAVRIPRWIEGTPGLNSASLSTTVVTKWNRMNKSIVLISTFIVAIIMANSANTEPPGIAVSFTEKDWQITLAADKGESRMENVAGQDAIYLRNGRIDLREVEFATGTIEFDIMTHGERGFGGIRWHVQQGKNSHEEFYIRPHMSGKPDANQYTPVFSGVSGWQLYFGSNYSTPVSYTFGEWMHIKVVVAEEQAEVYIGSDKPVLVIDDLKGDFGTGGLSLYANMSAFYFSNFRYQKQDTPVLTGSPKERQDLPKHLVSRFSVSGAVSETLVAETLSLPHNELPDQWTSLDVEKNGIANLARAANRTREANTVFARISIHSDSVQIKKLHFGYSDRVRVFLDEQAIYAGNNGYQTRDYRYLGTVGLFDQLYLPLKAGKNELYFAVSENFGGWGIMAAFEDMAGIKID